MNKRVRFEEIGMGAMEMADDFDPQDEEEGV